MNSPNRVFNLDAMTVALAGDPETRAKLTADYGLRETSSADDFVGTLIEAFDQVPIDNPVVLDRPPSDYFRAAVRALGSNSRGWTTFLRREAELAVLLDRYDPQSVDDRVTAGELSVDALLEFFPGQSRRGDATAVLQWADRLSRRDFGEETQACLGALTIRYLEEQDVEMPTSFV